LARCHGSDLLPLRLPFAHMPAVLFLTSPALWKPSGLACSRILPGADAHFVPSFNVFRLAGSFGEPPEPPAPCWRTVATLYPLGNCDSLKPETVLSYLTRLGTVSHRSSPLSPFFAFTDGARTPPEELVNFASATLPCGIVWRGWTNQPGPAFPQSPGIIPEAAVIFLSSDSAQVRIPDHPGWYFNGDSIEPRGPTSKSPTYPTQNDPKLTAKLQ